jgi:hypothetical protein
LNEAEGLARDTVTVDAFAVVATEPDGTVAPANWLQSTLSLGFRAALDVTKEVCAKATPALNTKRDRRDFMWFMCRNTNPSHKMFSKQGTGMMPM